MGKKQHIKTINPFFVKGTNPFPAINPLLTPEAQLPPILNIDTESHFREEKETASKSKEN